MHGLPVCFLVVSSVLCLQPCPVTPACEPSVDPTRGFLTPSQPNPMHSNVCVTKDFLLRVVCLLLAALSCFTSLRALSVMHPEGSPHLANQDDDFDGEQIIEPPLLPGMGVAAMAQPPAAAAAAAGSNGGSSGSDASKQRNVPWWTLPKGLMSLCLSHMDLTGRGARQCTGQQCQGASSSSSGSCCCLVPAATGQQQQRQQLLPGLGLGLSLFQCRPSPLRPLSKRRRQTQQRTGAGVDEGCEEVSASGGLGGCSDDGAAAAGADVDSAAALLAPPVCSCASALPAHFASLQALWFEHVTLPAFFMPRVLPLLGTSLESLAMLHVRGTQPEDMPSLSALTGVTSLRLIPSDHDVGGLEPLLRMKHIKKLSIK